LYQRSQGDFIHTLSALEIKTEYVFVSCLNIDEEPDGLVPKSL